ncbi:MAG: glycosyltransferase [Bacteroidetes bacterium]|nr:glycosyltransferase [Bacteroidota bacterium]
MKVVIISNTDSGGGAAIAARRLNDALNKNGVLSKMLVVNKVTASQDVVQVDKSIFHKAFTYIEYLLQRRVLLKDKSVAMFSTNKVGVDFSDNLFLQSADVINIHWVNFGCLSLNDIQKLYALKKPIVWTLHDMWLFTGGCHYSGDCLKYEKDCDTCPMLNFGSISHSVWTKKKEIFKGQHLNVITPSVWLGELCKTASLTNAANVQAIPNTLNTELFKPVSKAEACKKLNLDPSKKYLLFSAANPNDVRKGFSYFVEAIKIVKEQFENVELIVMGKEQKAFENLPLKLNYVGFIKSEEAAATVYNAASVFVIPSLEDNLPNTILEALACGTPSVGFAIGGIKEMIATGVNGYLAQPKNAEDLAKGIVEVLKNPKSESARNSALQRYSANVVVQKHVEFFKSISK